MDRGRVNHGKMLLMLRLPSIRQKLAHDLLPTIDELIETYDVAHTARETFAKEGDFAKQQEFQTICLEIEEEVVELLLHTARD